MAQHSRLLTLSGELRNRIYEYTLPDVSTVFISRGGFVQPPPLAQVCYQIREELAGYLRALPWVETRTIMAKVIDCDFRHVIEICEALTEADVEHIECLHLKLTLTHDEPIDWRLLAHAADAIFQTRPQQPHAPPNRTGHNWLHEPWEVMAVIGKEKKVIRHELEVDMVHTARDYFSCTCSRLVKENAWLPMTAIDDGGPRFNPRALAVLKKELESAFQQSHSGTKEKLRKQRNEAARRKIERSLKEQRERVQRAAGQALEASVGEVLLRADELDRAVRRNLRAMSREKEAVVLHWFQRFSERRKEGKDVSVLHALFKASDGAEMVLAA